MSEREYAKVIAKNLRRIMFEKGRTQADLARDLDISKATLSSWMNGTRIPRMDKIDLLCHYFNVQRADIMEEYADRQENKSAYYLNPETARIAQEVFDSPETRILFDAARNARPQDILLAAEMLKRFKETNPDG